MKFFDCITCRAIDQGVSIAVEDTGEGIHNDKKAIIFDRFSQVDTKMTRASEGTGIGLALTRSLVELLGGKISVESVYYLYKANKNRAYI